ncbi:dTDP-4-dehydrorhamnose reductase-like protein [Hahella chejuensis KCTC 2396]|uniref:dTDP-4-dehydrorhamnose reductase-like protein n=1 Tax=Hahella chejuensis (strain KCTC 2396) TaxID=349521 RepID=Q2SQA2_HAHCH|nr:NAD(P)-dependent oxidoreductase [Hahella chejuensis]ABC27172.1 dTDP-4-dehydrorhamnose reductase-like protein [Hahella chejuensis KCTC 2396]
MQLFSNEAKKPRVLVTGASGFLGAHICRALNQDYEVLAQSHQVTLPEDLAPFRVRQDLCDAELTQAMFRNLTPDAVIHAAALSDPNTCQQQPERSLQVNVEATRLLAALCAERDIPLLFTSTDLVFDGRQGVYRESDPVNPINRYGEHKAMAEKLIREQHPRATIVRMPWMFGLGLLKPSGVTQWLERLRQGETLTGFVDEYRSAVDYATAAQGIVRFFQMQQGLTLHLGGIETVSRHHFLKALARTFGLDEDLVQEQKQRDVIMPAKRPRDVSLDSRRARGLGYKTPFMDEMLAELRNI